MLEGAATSAFLTLVIQCTTYVRHLYLRIIKNEIVVQKMKEKSCFTEGGGGVGLLDTSDFCELSFQIYEDELLEQRVAIAAHIAS